MRKWISDNQRWLLAAAILILFDLGTSSLATCVGGEQQQAEKCAEEGYGLLNSITARTFLWFVGLVDGNSEFVQAAAAIVVAIFTVTLWRTTTGLLKSAHDQAVIARRAARAAWDAASAAEQQVRVGVMTAEAAQQSADHIPRVERAYVFIEPKYVGGGASRLMFHYNLRNHGKTPAIIKSIDANAAILETEPDNTTHKSTETLDDEIVLISGAVWPRETSRNKDCTWDAATQGEILKARRAFVWFYGSIVYDDVFGNERVTRFRWKIKDWDKSRFHADGGKPYNERT